MAASGEAAGLPRGGLSHSALSWPPALETGWRGRGPGASRPGPGRWGPPTFLSSVVVSESFLPPTSQGRGSGDCLGLPGPPWICGRSSVSSVPQWSVIRCRPAGLSLPPLGGHCEHRPVDPQDGAAAVCPPGLGWTQTVTHLCPERDARTTPPESPSAVRLALRSSPGPPRAWCCWNPASAEASCHLSPQTLLSSFGGGGLQPPRTEAAALSGL